MTKFIKQSLSGDYKELHLDSRDMDGFGVFNLDENLKIKKIFLIELSMRFAWYTVNDSNNKINFIEGITPALAIIPPGNYNQINILATLKTAFETVSPGLGVYTVTFDTITLKLTISATVTFSLLFATGLNILQSASDILGFSIIDTSASLSHTGDEMVNLSGELYIFLKLEQNLMHGNNNGLNTVLLSQDKQIMAKIPINVNPGEIILYKPDTIVPVTISKNIKNTPIGIKLLMTFRDNIAIDLNESHWSIKLGIISY